MRTKLIIFVLIAALIAMPANTATVIMPQKPQPKWVLQAFCAVVILAAAGTMVYHLWKWCKKIPTGPPPEDPPEPGVTNTPPRQLIGDTVIDPSKFVVETIPGESIGCWNVSGYPNQRGFDILMGTTLESSNDMTNWVPSLSNTAVNSQSQYPHMSSHIDSGPVLPGII